MTNDTRERMLDAAAELVQAHGFHGASLGDILKLGKAPRGSLYFHFPGGKSQLVAESTRATVDEVTRLRAGFAAESHSPGELVRRIGRSIVDVLESTDYRRSCPVSPLIFDGLAHEGDLAALPVDALEEWTAVLRSAFESYGLKKSRAAALALLSQSVFQGAALIALATRQASVVQGVIEQFAEMLDAETKEAKGHQALAG